MAVDGDAPKDFVRAYAYGDGLKSYPKTWPAFIAKVGHKWYPNESITEHLITRIGQGLGLEMADSELRLADAQLRFCSRYFLKPKEILIHGAEIFIGYLEDKEFVEKLENAEDARNLFTFQVVEEAIMNAYLDEAPVILRGFFNMLVFDALVGNNDRHHYNWGVVADLDGRRAPRFSPIYDSARGLFWSRSDELMDKLAADPNRYSACMEKYIVRSRPETGWDGTTDPNHFQLIEQIVKKDSDHANSLKNLLSQPIEKIGLDLLFGEFDEMFSEPRKKAILDCLKCRHQRLALISV